MGSQYYWSDDLWTNYLGNRQRSTLGSFMYGDVLCCGFDLFASDEVIKNERKFSENLKNIFRKYVTTVIK